MKSVSGSLEDVGEWQKCIPMAKLDVMASPRPIYLQRKNPRHQRESPLATLPGKSRGQGAGRGEQPYFSSNIILGETVTAARGRRLEG